MLSGCVLIVAALLQMSSPEVSITSALSELNKGRVLESIEQFREIVRSDPANGAAYYYLSTLYTQLGELDIAERYVRRAIEWSPRQSAHYLQLGLIRYRQSQWRPALEFYRQALELDAAGSSQATVWRNIGDVQLELFDREAALEAYENAVRLQPQDAAARLALGRFYLERSDSKRAIPHLQKAIELNSKLRAAYPLLGRAYRQAGDLPRAIAVLRDALESDAADQDTRYALAQALLASGRDDEGRAEMDKYASVRRQVETANADFRTAQARIEEGKAGEAERLLRDSVRLAPRYGPALQALGALLLDRGSAREAAGFLQRALEATPLNAESWFKLAEAYLKNGKLVEAMEAAKRAVVLKEEDLNYQRLLMEIQSRIKK